MNNEKLLFQQNKGNKNEENNETRDIRDNNLTPFNLESNSLTSTTGDEIPTSSLQVRH